ncbi:MAG: hypothetical protein AAFO91_12000, partial [Bacteroidota bacterium]
QYELVKFLVGSVYSTFESVHSVNSNAGEFLYLDSRCCYSGDGPINRYRHRNRTSEVPMPILEALIVDIRVFNARDRYGGKCAINLTECLTAERREEERSAVVDLAASDSTLLLLSLTRSVLLFFHSLLLSRCKVT